MVFKLLSKIVLPNLEKVSNIINNNLIIITSWMMQIAALSNEHMNTFLHTFHSTQQRI